MCKGVGRIHQDLDPARMRSIGNLAHRQDLAIPVDHVGDMHEFGTISHRCHKLVGDLILTLNWKIKIQPFQHHSIAVCALFPGVDHVGIILPGEDDFVSGFESQPEDHGFNRFG